MWPVSNLNDGAGNAGIEERHPASSHHCSGTEIMNASYKKHQSKQSLNFFAQPYDKDNDNDNDKDKSRAE